MQNRRIGPNLKKLIIQKMSVEAIPAGGGMADALKVLTTPGGLSAALRDATVWCDAAIAAIRQGREPNPWKVASEEEIAGMLVREIEKKKARKTLCPSK